METALFSNLIAGMGTTGITPKLIENSGLSLKPKFAGFHPITSSPRACVAIVPAVPTDNGVITFWANAQLNKTNNINIFFMIAPIPLHPYFGDQSTILRYRIIIL